MRFEIDVKEYAERKEDSLYYEPEPIMDELTGTGTGSFCPMTKRVMLISPLPERVRSLLVALSSDCFDVFSLHDFDPNMLPALQPELLIYDAATASSRYEPQAREHLLMQAGLAGVPVLMLFNGRSHAARPGVKGSAGAVELLEWPARPELAMRRIRGMLGGQTAGPAPQASEHIRMFKDIYVDLKRKTVDQGGRRVELTKTEFDLLLRFITSDGSVISREALLDSVWGMQFYGGSNVIDVHMKSLRKKLKDSAVSPKYIVTVRGAGYRLADNKDGG